MKYKIYNKKILITGGSDGLGLSLIEILLEKKNKITCLDIDESKSEYFNDKGVIFYKIDLRNIENIKKLSNSINFGDFDLIINCAGYEIGSFFKEVPFEEFQNNFNCNFFSHIFIIKEHIIKKNYDNKTKILNMTSDTAFRSIPTRSSYCASKSAFQSFSESMRLELKNFNIDVITVLPPKLDTNFFKKIEYFGKLKIDKIPYSDSRPFYSREKFAKKIIKGVEQNYLFINVFNVTKFFLLINFIFPKLADNIVEKLSTWKKLKK